MTRKELLLSTIKGGIHRRKPVWLMRQAGRFLPSYRALRKRYDFLTLCTTPELASEVTLLPLYELDVDVLVLFSDILIPLKAVGVDIFYSDGRMPQVVGINLSNLNYERDTSSLSFVEDTIRLVKQAEPDMPLVGFAAAPFTLACYLFDSGSDFSSIRSFIYNYPERFTELMEELSLLTLDYLKLQARAGCDAVQLFDTWVGVLPRGIYAEFVHEFNRRIISGLGNIPSIYYARSATHLMDLIITLDADCFGVDWREDVVDVHRRTGKCVQGNLDNALLLSSKDSVIKATGDLLEKTLNLPHIVNLGHGVLPESSPDLARALIDTVHSF